ncbi:MAG TPA: hypothetical protein VLX92_14270 [Kofleriaceae bacterium]|nr:hypothetical protein [Kofleriaceae bacterium]
MRRWIFAALLVATAAPRARADDRPRRSHRSPALATALSIAGTVAPAALLGLASQSTPFDGPIHLDDGAVAALVTGGAVGMVIGPSAGNIYAGHVLTEGLALRLAGAIGFLIGYDVLSTEGNQSSGIVFAGLGLGLVAAGTIYDIQTASRDAERYNERHAIQLVPTAIAQGHTRVPGVAIVGQF